MAGVIHIAYKQLTKQLSRGNCHVVVVSNRYWAETGYWTQRIHPLLTVWSVR